MKKRKLSAAEITKADKMALDYMQKQADTMEEFGHGRPSDEQVAGAAAKVADSIKRLWRLQESSVG